jgi:DNA-binding response OmpR family regulator
MDAGTILIADDEETFRESTSRLLQRAGYQCQCVKDAEDAVESLRHRRFDVLISDIRMPRNADLRLVREARQLDNDLPIILVTGFPSAETAIHGIEMAVDGYLTKPLDVGDLMEHVHKAAERSHVRRRLTAVVERLHSVVTDLEVERLKPLSLIPGTEANSLATIRTLASCLSELVAVWGQPAADRGLRNLCDLLDCPQRPVHRQALLDVIDVLKRTKDNFKSKQLAELRSRLERTMRIE